MDSQTAINVALQANAPGLTILMLIISIFGQPEFYLVIIPLILWCCDKKLGLRLVFLLSISTAINAVLKILFHTPRPYWVSSEVKAFASEPSFGMPSGHAQTSLVFLGYIGSKIKKIKIWAVCIALIILVGIARIYLGVHFLTDVLAGWIVAIIILFFFVRYETVFSEWFLQRPLNVRILFAFCASISLVIVSELVKFCLGSWQVPSDWSAMAFVQTNLSIAPLSGLDALMAAGLLFGAAVGAIISSDYLPFVIDGNASRKAIRYIIGIIILFFVWIGLSAVAKSPGLVGYGMTYIRAAIVGGWVTFGAPLLFYKLGLVDKEKKSQ